MTARPRAKRLAQTVAVAVVSDARPAALLACLAALAAQARPADDVIVVIRREDFATRDALAGRSDDALPMRVVAIDVPGVVAARNAALAACRSDVVAFCDDDTRAHPDWIGRIIEHFARDEELGGLGGRDRCHDGEKFDDRRRDTVGRVRWYGRAIGNHHLGHGAAREVHFLKGANMSFRREAVAGLHFDARLRGRRIQAHEDFSFSLSVRRAGWKLLYDPAVALDHHAIRRDGPHRTYVAGSGAIDAEEYADHAFNHALAIRVELSPAAFAAFAAWSLLIGSRAYPGLLQAARLMAGEGSTIWRKFFLTQRAIAAVPSAALQRGSRPLAPTVGAREAL